uniref:Uncharacterized protein n=1 Tax=Cuerna arida TaxID=1464854 RepID=A0A1B6FT93_9HEMI
MNLYNKKIKMFDMTVYNEAVFTVLVLMGGLYANDDHGYKEIQLLDKEITKILILPFQNEAEILVQKMSTFSKIFSDIKERFRCRDNSVLPTAMKLHRKGKPTFLTSIISRDTLCQTFKWSQTEMGLFDFLYHDCESLWNNFEEIFKLQQMHDEAN